MSGWQNFMGFAMVAALTVMGLASGDTAFIAGSMVGAIVMVAHQ